MKPTDDLFQLIHSLTASEKRQFKIYASKHVIGKKNNYELLFDSIVKLPTDTAYDEALFKQQNKNKSFVKYFADEKKHLMEILVAGLTSFKINEENDLELSIQQLLREADFFRQKRLINLRLKSLQKAFALAEKHELFQQQIEIINHQFSTLIENKQEHFSQLQNQFDEQLQSLTEKQQQLNLLQFYAHKSLLLLRIDFNGKPTNALTSNEFLEIPVIKNYQVGTSHRIDISYFSILSRIERANGRKEKQNFYNQKIYECFERNDFLKKTNSLNYRTSTYNYLNSLLNLDDFKTFEKVLTAYKNIPIQNKDEAGEQWQNTTAIEVLYLLNAGKYELASTKYKEVLDGLKTYAHKVNNATKIVLLSNLAVCLFIDKQYDKTIVLNNMILEDSSDVRLDLKRDALFLEILLHYQLTNYSLIESLLRSIKRKPYSASEKLCLQFFEKALKAGEVSKTFAKEGLESFRAAGFETSTKTFALLCMWLESYL